MIDTKKEHIAVTEARKLGLPVVAVVDTNCDPDVIDYVIPGNDDAIRSGALMCRVLADAVVEGRFIAEYRRKNAPPAAEEASSGPSPRQRRIPAPPPAPVDRCRRRRTPRRLTGQRRARAREPADAAVERRDPSTPSWPR